MDRSYNTMRREEVLSIINLLGGYIFFGTVLVIPFFFLPITTDALEAPKQVFLVVATLLSLVFFAVGSIVEKRFSFRRTPFDLALGILFVTILLSVFFSGAKTVSIIAAVPLLGVVLFSFLLVSTITSPGRQRLLTSVLLGSAAILSLLTVLQFLKIYILPYELAKTPSFSLGGSLLTTVMFLATLLPIGLFHVRSYFRKGAQGREEDIWDSFFLGAAFLIAVGVVLGLYQLIGPAKPTLLPQETGLRTALQPLGINFPTALFGTGPGTYLFNFTRFKDVELNSTPLWNLRFTNSSSFFLEILSTLGILGAISYLFLTFRVISSYFRGTHTTQTAGVFFSLLLLFIFSFFLPFSFLTVFLLFVLLALYSIHLALEKNPHIFDVTLSIVALRKGLFSLDREPGSASSATDLLPYILAVLVTLLAGFVGLNMKNFLVSDMTFQKALVAAQQNQIQQTYDLQNETIGVFPQRDMYHRVFSQTNLAIASSLAEQARTASASAAQQQDIITLAQQSINFGRNAVTLSPLNIINWENLTNVYRSLIGFAQDADQFAVASARQAIALEPTNPVLHVTL